MDMQIMTVTGPISPEEVGTFLPHEHIMSCFGMDPAENPQYPVDELLAQVLPYLEKVKDLGLRTLADCTTAYFGRDPLLLRRISEESGIYLITNTGYYGAANGRYIPEHAYTESTEQIATRWTREWQDGIGDTGIRPGFIKTAVGDGPLSEINRKLIRAAILTHLQTGLTIQTHLGNNVAAADEILDMFDAEGADPGAWIWVHAHSMTNPNPLLKAASRGAWISLDGLSLENAKRILQLMKALKITSLFGQALLSHDGDLYCQGNLRPFDYLFTDFIPMMTRMGYKEEDIHALTVENPAIAFTVTPR